MRTMQAYTFLELLVTLGLVASLLALGVPSVRIYLQNQQLKHGVTQLVSDLRYARMAAIDRNQRVVICPGRPADGCRRGPHWEDGWMIFADDNADRQWQAHEDVLRVAPTWSGMTITSVAARRRLSFFPDGSAPGSNATLWLCDGRGPGYGYHVRINLAGRIASKRSDDSGPMAC